MYGNPYFPNTGFHVGQNLWVQNGVVIDIYIIKSQKQKSVVLCKYSRESLLQYLKFYLLFYIFNGLSYFQFYLFWILNLKQKSGT